MDMDLKTMTDSELERHLATLTDAEVARLSVSNAREAGNRRGQIGPDESRKINRCHRERARRFTLADRASRNADSQERTGTTSEIKAPVAVSAQPSPSQNRLKFINQPTKGESSTMSTNQPKPEPPVSVVVEKARAKMAAEHARGNRFYSISEAVMAVRAELGLTTDHLNGDAALTERSLAQRD